MVSERFKSTCRRIDPIQSCGTWVWWIKRFKCTKSWCYIMRDTQEHPFTPTPQQIASNQHQHWSQRQEIDRPFQSCCLSSSKLMEGIKERVIPQRPSLLIAFWCHINFTPQTLTNIISRKWSDYCAAWRLNRTQGQHRLFQRDVYWGCSV